MKKLYRVLFGAALVAAAVASAPQPAYAISRACVLCQESYDCFWCCECSGGTYNYCYETCQ